ncbi:MAG: hypothetical protein WCO53_00560 [Deltaproteobacteria bacterium]
MKSVMPAKQKRQKNTARPQPALLDELARAFVHTNEFKTIVRSVIPEVASQWAGRNPLKKIAADLAAKSIQKSFAQNAEDLPSLINGILGVLDNALKEASILTEEEISRLTASLTGTIDAGIIGSIITRMAVLVNKVHAAEPVFISEEVRWNFRRFIEAVDFGEIKEAVDGSHEDFTAMMRMVNEEMWRYPAKMICLFSLLPSALNMTVSAVKETLKPLHAQAPDVLADVIFSLMRSLDGKAAGELVNGLSEVVRQIHTGSALIGDQGLPQFGADLRILLADFASALDPEVLVKARTALAQDLETIRNAWTETMAERPDLFLSELRQVAERRNPAIRATRREFALLADMPESDVNDALSAGLSDLDTQELGETINTILRLLNSLRRSHPETIPRVFAGVAATIDTDELKDATTWIIPAAVDAVKPLAGAIMPSVLRGLAELLRPESGDDTDDMANAIAEFKTALQGVTK